MFPQAPYQLSVCYRASAALLVADVVLQPSPPPRTVASAVSPATLPVIRQVSDPVPIDGDILTVTGERFAGASVIVQFDGAPLPTTPLGAATLSCTLSGPDLRAGSGDLRVLRDGVLSDAFPLALGPRLKAVSAKVKESSAGWSGEIEVSLSPPLQPGQSLELDLFSAGGNGGAYGFVYDAPWNGTVPLGKVQVPVAGLAAGRYAVLIKVDDAAGRLARNAAGAYGPPLLRIGKAAS
jgi:hypothetical protein